MGMFDSMTSDGATSQTRRVMVLVGVWGALVASGCSGERLVVGDEEEAVGSSGAAGSGSAGKGGSGSGGSEAGGSGSGGSGSGGSESGGAAGAPADVDCPCTRRVPNVGWGCYVGSGKRAELPIASKGGTLVLDGTESTGVSLDVTFPVGALEERTVVSITELPEPPPDDYVDYSPMYLLEPTGTALNAPVAVRVPWSSSLNLVDPALAIYRGPTPEGPFEIADDNYINAGFNQGRLTEFGYFFVGYPKNEELAACP